ncbi:MAG: KamA family radical SAM protein [Deltaproteobacteria bacterium]|nr:KamA family radical SAM protein [Deltaproteobacteria bacterium]
MEIEGQLDDPGPGSCLDNSVCESSTRLLLDIQDSAAHRELVNGEFWRCIPAFAHISAATFLDHSWQSRNSVNSPKQLCAVLGNLLPESFYADVVVGTQHASMSMRVSPYLLALIDWADPYHDPIRRQFIPLGSEQIPDHPMVRLDSLSEQRDSPVAGLIHRYPDRVLFIALHSCPAYCRFCTRSYAVGSQSEKVQKIRTQTRADRWKMAFRYIRSRPEIEDVVVSGGDLFHLPAESISFIGRTLLEIPHVRRIRLGTRGLAVMPMKILTDDRWFRHLASVAERGRKLRKEVALHTHFAHPRELTTVTQRAMSRLFDNGLTVRNQCVLLRGVNDDFETLRLLIKRLGYLNVHPYYVYQHDLVSRVEDLRTALHTTLEIEKNVRGATAGFNTPTFVIDLPGGGGKRDVHSFEYYDRITGISVYRSPCVNPDTAYLYFDPIYLLPEEGKRLWGDPSNYKMIINQAVHAAGLGTMRYADLPHVESLE